MHKPEEYGLEETQKFIPLESSEPSTKIVDPNVLTQAFNGLSKNEIIKYGSDPFWVKIRWAIFAVFWLAWIGMLVLAVFIVVFTPKCPYRPKLQWWQSEVIYQLDVMKFKDSDGDGIGDLQGAIEKLNYVDKLGAKVVCLNENWLDSQDPLKIRVDIGSENKMRVLKKTLEEKGMYLMLDIPVSALNTNDNEILSKWLTDYADGIRITQLDKWAADDKDKKEKLNKWVKIGQDIFDKTFKAKMVMFYPYTQKEKDVLTPGLIVNQNFLKIKDSDLKDSTNFIENSQFNETSYILNDFSTTERIRDRLNGTRYHSIYHGLVLLLKGTPMILYGDELEYTKADKNMKWDNSKPACGFTTQNKSIDDCSNTVKHAQSYGSNKELLKMYERLIKLRRNEPSFKWGSIKTKNDSVNVVSYVREADRFDGFVIIGNLDNERHLVDLEQRHLLPNDAKVEYYHAADGIPNPDFSQNQVVHTDNVQVKPGDLIVLRFSREPDSGNSKSSEVAAAHG